MYLSLISDDLVSVNEAFKFWHCSIIHENIFKALEVKNLGKLYFKVSMLRNAKLQKKLKCNNRIFFNFKDRDFSFSQREANDSTDCCFKKRCKKSFVEVLCVLR